MLGNKIKFIVESAGYSVKDLADLTGKSVQTFYSLYRSDNTEINTLRVIATAIQQPITIVIEPETEDSITSTFMVNEDMPLWGKEKPLKARYTECLENNMQLNVALKKAEQEIAELKARTIPGKSPAKH